MKITYRFLTLFVVLAFLLAPTGAVHAQGSGPDGEGRVIFGSNFTLASGESFKGDLVVFGGNVVIEENADLKGNLVVFGGIVESNGQVNGDVVIIGGQVNLDEKAHVTGDVVTIGGQLQQAEGAQVDGDVVNDVQPEIDIPIGQFPPDITLPEGVPVSRIDVGHNPFADYSWLLFLAVVVSAFAMLLSLFWQKQIGRAGNIIVTQPLMTSAIGLLTTFLGTLFIIAILPPIFVAFAWLFGVVAMGSEVGERFTKAINQTWTPVLTIGFGTFLLMLVGGAIGMIPCLGAIILFLLGILGVGGAVVTWFGLRQVQNPAVIAYTPPTDAGQVPPAS